MQDVATYELMKSKPNKAKAFEPPTLLSLPHQKPFVNGLADTPPYLQIPLDVACVFAHLGRQRLGASLGQQAVHGRAQLAVAGVCFLLARADGRDALGDCGGGCSLGLGLDGFSVVVVVLTIGVQKFEWQQFGHSLWCPLCLVCRFSLCRPCCCRCVGLGLFLGDLGRRLFSFFAGLGLGL